VLVTNPEGNFSVAALKSIHLHRDGDRHWVGSPKSAGSGPSTWGRKYHSISLLKGDGI